MSNDPIEKLSQQISGIREHLDALEQVHQQRYRQIRDAIQSERTNILIVLVVVAAFLYGMR